MAEWIRQEFPSLPQHLCRDRPQPLNLLHVAWLNDHFDISGGRGRQQAGASCHPMTLGAGRLNG